MTPSVYELFEKIDKIKGKKAKIEALSQYSQNRAIISVLQVIFDPRYKFQLPDGPTPYRPSDFLDQQGALYQGMRRLPLFLEGHNDLHPTKRETLWIQFLEGLDANDAVLMDNAKDKKMFFKSITREIVDAAFPGLLPNVQNKEEKLTEPV